MKTVLFDLDGTLLPMDEDRFRHAFGTLVCSWFAQRYSFDPAVVAPALNAGIAAMAKNDAHASNETVFCREFSRTLPIGEREVCENFRLLYRTRFDELQTLCPPRPDAEEPVRIAAEKGLCCVLATDPVFAEDGVLARLRWAGIDRSLFSLISTADAFGYCKPNPGYFRVICHRTESDPADCLMVGNSETADLPAKNVGMRVFLLEDASDGTFRECDGVVRGDFAALKEYLRRL